MTSARPAPWLALVAAIVLSVWSDPARAVSLRTEVSSRQVGVGERIVVRVTAVQGDDDDAPSSPHLKVTGAAELQGPNVATQNSMRMHNFSVTTERSVVATWLVTPTAAGQLTIGPATFLLGNQKLTGETIVVRVDDAAARQPARAAPDPFDPFSFDPFSLRGPRPSAPSRNFGLSEAPEKLQMEQAPHAVAFLRAMVSKRKVVVGEPFTLEMYVYGSRGQFREVSPTEPTTAEFLSFPVVEHSQEEPPYVTTIGDEQWFLVKVREIILVPLRAGKSAIGGMEAFVQGPGYPNRGNRYGMQVRSAPLEIEVIEPPLADRPDGYLLGDVGRVGLTAELSSRKLNQGEYLQLIVQVKGSGHLPSRVRLPSIPGLEWQEPSLEGGPRVRDGKLGGSRVIKIAGRVTLPGELVLGEVTLPYYDAGAHQYKIAHAELGRVEVIAAPVAPANVPSSPAATPGAGQRPEGLALEPRATLRPQAPATATWLRPWHWGALLGLPVLVLIGHALASLARAWQARKAAGPTPRKVKKQTLAAASKSAIAGDWPTTLRELERALYDAIEQATSIRGRGILRSHLASSLRDTGLDPDLAEATGSMIVELEALRYDAGTETPKALVERNRRLLDRLEKAARKRPATERRAPTGRLA